MIDIFAMNHWSWLILGLALLVLELTAPFMFFLWLGISAIVTALVLFFVPEMSWEFQFLIFSVLSIVSVVASRKYFAKNPLTSELPKLNRREQQYVGRVFTLIEPITNGYGKISVDDSQWRVKGPKLAEGQQVKVVSADGGIFEVEPVVQP